jgi:hypothetical protein
MAVPVYVTVMISAEALVDIVARADQCGEQLDGMMHSVRLFVAA